MAPANLDLVRVIYAAWERGEFDSAAWADPEIEYVQADGPNAQTSRGLAAMAHAFGDWLRAWEDWRVKAEEFRELDAERVLVLFHFSARGRASGLEVGQIWTEGAQLFHLRDGKVTKLVQYLERAGALAELGLAGRKKRVPGGAGGLRGGGAP